MLYDTTNSDLHLEMILVNRCSLTILLFITYYILGKLKARVTPHYLLLTDIIK